VELFGRQPVSPFQIGLSDFLSHAKALPQVCRFV
jgi:hypothetical protein